MAREHPREFFANGISQFEGHQSRNPLEAVPGTLSNQSDSWEGFYHECGPNRLKTKTFGA